MEACAASMDSAAHALSAALNLLASPALLRASKVSPSSEVLEEALVTCEGAGTSCRGSHGRPH